MKQGKLIVFSAPSGSGKTTLVHHLLNQEDLKLAFSVSATSREKRPNEIDGKDYYFISNESFEDKISKNQFVEYEEVYRGTYYGTLKSELERIWAQGKNIIFDIDVIGGLNIKKQFSNQTLAVFVRPPSVEELEKRLRNRQTESDEKIKMRVEKASKELESAHLFDVIIENQNLEQAKRDAYELVKAYIEQ